MRDAGQAQLARVPVGVEQVEEPVGLGGPDGAERVGSTGEARGRGPKPAGVALQPVGLHGAADRLRMQGGGLLTQFGLGRVRGEEGEGGGHRVLPGTTHPEGLGARRLPAAPPAFTIGLAKERWGRG